MNSRHRRGKATGRAALAGAMVLATGLLVAVQWATARPASAVPTLHKVSGPSSAINSVSPKQARAECPLGERVVGGGGSVLQNTNIPFKGLALTRLQPIHPATGKDSYEVTGSEVGAPTTANWFVTAYALCADPGQWPGGNPNLQIVPVTSSPSTQTVQTATAGPCPSGQRVIGTGAQINNPGGQVVLQVARVDINGGIARAQAHAVAATYPSPWSVTSYAVCANTPPGYKVIFGQSEQRASEDRKVASAVCPSDSTGRPRYVHGAGAAVTNLAPGEVGLTQVVPFDRTVFAEAREHASTPASWDFIVAAAICAY
jgi:hypothetical protein